jgi:hypothetical protein
MSEKDNSVPPLSLEIERARRAVLSPDLARYRVPIVESRPAPASTCRAWRGHSVAPLCVMCFSARMPRFRREEEKRGQPLGGVRRRPARGEFNLHARY